MIISHPFLSERIGIVWCYATTKRPLLLSHIPRLPQPRPPHPLHPPRPRIHRIHRIHRVRTSTTSTVSAHPPRPPHPPRLLCPTRLPLCHIHRIRRVGRICYIGHAPCKGCYFATFVV